MEPDKKNIFPGKNTESMGVGLPTPKPSVEENKQKLADSLHKDGELPNLRTYQGDIAQFILSKDKSLSDVVLKQQQKKTEEKIKNESLGIKTEKKKEKSNLSTNFIMYVISLCLLVGVFITGGYFYIVNQNKSDIVEPIGKTIIPSDHMVIVDLNTLSTEGMKESISSIKNDDEKNAGITSLNIVSGDNVSATPNQIIDKLNLLMPDALRRTLGNEIMVGVYDVGNTPNYFLVLKVLDYGIAFRDMLAWENNIVNDLTPFLDLTSNQQSASNSTSTLISTTKYIFKDLIVRNKDTRAAVSGTNKVELIYTFLDKQTILITESESAIKGLIDAYIAGNTVR